MLAFGSFKVQRELFIYISYVGDGTYAELISVHGQSNSKSIDID